MRLPCSLHTCAVLLMLAGLAPPVHAVIVIQANGTPGRNLVSLPVNGSSPPGAQFEGTFDGFLGTAIAPNLFITANHIGGNVGDAFVFQGTTYTTTATFGDPNGTDLRIWQVNGTLPTYAPLYTSSNEVGRNIIAYGRGDAPDPNNPLVASPGPGLNGWYWGGYDGQTSYGQSQVTDNGAITGLTGNYLQFAFATSTSGSATPSVYNAILASGDSGGGDFVQDTNGIWKLAGINYGVGEYSLTPNGPLQNAAVFDARGLYDGSQYISPSLPYDANVYGYSASSRISSSLGFINSVISSVPEPSSWALMGLGLAFLAGIGRACSRTRPGAEEPDFRPEPGRG